MLEVIKNIASVLGCISLAFTLLFTLSKTVKRWIAVLFKTKEDEERETATIKEICAKLDKFIKDNTEFKRTIQDDIEVQKDFSRDQCRNIIKDIFYKYCEQKKIPLYELKTATNVFNTYSDPKKLNANHWIKYLYDEMCTWEIDYTHSFEEE